MITLIHGDDIPASRDYFYQEKNRLPQSISVDGITVRIEDIAQRVTNTSLFGGETTIFIEELFSKRKSDSDVKDIILYLNNHNDSPAVYLWESKVLTPSQIKQLDNPIIKEFKLPSSIFTFLDNLKPGNGIRLITLFHKTLEHKDEQFVFFMLVRHIRLLLASFSESSEAVIEEAKKMVPWQKAKLQKQTQMFTLEKITGFYAKLFEIDLALKTGRLACPFSQTIDFLLLEL